MLGGFRQAASLAHGKKPNPVTPLFNHPRTQNKEMDRKLKCHDKETQLMLLSHPRENSHHFYKQKHLAFPVLRKGKKCKEEQNNENINVVWERTVTRKKQSTMQLIFFFSESWGLEAAVSEFQENAQEKQINPRLSVCEKSEEGLESRVIRIRWWQLGQCCC